MPVISFTPEAQPINVPVYPYGYYNGFDTNPGAGAVADDWPEFKPVKVNKQGQLESPLVLFDPSTGITSYLVASDGDSDGISPTAIVAFDTRVFPFLYNSENNEWNREHGNDGQSILANGTRNSTTNSADQENINWKGAHVIVDITAIPGVDTITVKIQGKDPVSGNYYDILTSAALSTTGTYVLKIHPGINQIANAATPDVLPHTWRIRVEHSGGGNFDYSIGANLEI